MTMCTIRRSFRYTPAFFHDNRKIIVIIVKAKQFLVLFHLMLITLKKSPYLFIVFMQEVLRHHGVRLPVRILPVLLDIKVCIPAGGHIVKCRSAKLIAYLRQAAFHALFRIEGLQRFLCPDCALRSSGCGQQFQKLRFGMEGKILFYEQAGIFS